MGILSIRSTCCAGYAGMTGDGKALKDVSTAQDVYLRGNSLSHGLSYESLCLEDNRCVKGGCAEREEHNPKTKWLVRLVEIRRGVRSNIERFRFRILRSRVKP